MKKGTGLILLFFGILIALGFWYNAQYSMYPVEKTEYNSKQSKHSVLIATQGSRYKDKVVTSIIESYSDKNVHLTVIDVNSLHLINSDNFDAIIVMHTWEMWKIPKSVKDFYGYVNNDKLFCISTSGGGDLMPEGIDGISSASTMATVEEDINKIKNWLSTKISG